MQFNAACDGEIFQDLYLVARGSCTSAARVTFQLYFTIITKCNDDTDVEIDLLDLSSFTLFVTDGSIRVHHIDGVSAANLNTSSLNLSDPHANLLEDNGVSEISQYGASSNQPTCPLKCNSSSDPLIKKETASKVPEDSDAELVRVYIRNDKIRLRICDCSSVLKLDLSFSGYSPILRDFSSMKHYIPLRFLPPLFQIDLSLELPFAKDYPFLIEPCLEEEFRKGVSRAKIDALLEFLNQFSCYKDTSTQKVNFSISNLQSNPEFPDFAKHIRLYERMELDEKLNFRAKYDCDTSIHLSDCVADIFVIKHVLHLELVPDAQNPHFGREVNAILLLSKNATVVNVTCHCNGGMAPKVTYIKDDTSSIVTDSQLCEISIPDLDDSAASISIYVECSEPCKLGSSLFIPQVSNYQLESARSSITVPRAPYQIEPSNDHNGSWIIEYDSANDKIRCHMKSSGCILKPFTFVLNKCNALVTSLSCLKNECTFTDPVNIKITDHEPSSIDLLLRANITSFFEKGTPVAYLKPPNESIMKWCLINGRQPTPEVPVIQTKDSSLIIIQTADFKQLIEICWQVKKAKKFKSSNKEESPHLSALSLPTFVDQPRLQATVDFSNSKAFAGYVKQNDSIVTPVKGSDKYQKQLYFESIPKALFVEHTEPINTQDSKFVKPLHKPNRDSTRRDDMKGWARSSWKRLIFYIVALFDIFLVTLTFQQVYSSRPSYSSGSSVVEVPSTHCESCEQQLLLLNKTLRALEYSVVPFTEIDDRYSYLSPTRLQFNGAEETKCENTCLTSCSPETYTPSNIELERQQFLDALNAFNIFHWN
ncbi:hypothetical protein SJAG_04251 [Schizosaccharomyces japonicus yFS275]|uniref:Uncharacterized protein n=1 Tax=Schizosaccharomyces japonicus (strain yFS275 / FY16936) TaxID=402676 RepID=B6K6C2_SCHJY|nr:hypothetical protein SJAG_04251 [Schizosaccharomyces japonicus yFS275]EEB09076.1 hypothetical protein SJAG_04251 [Schizosaccharomyces japonicus yFS275]